MPINTAQQFSIALEALPGIPIDKRLPVLEDILEFASICRREQKLISIEEPDWQALTTAILQIPIEQCLEIAKKVGII